MKKSILLTIATCFVLIATLSADNAIKQVAPFDEIVLSGNINVVLIAGNEESVEIKEEENKVSVNVSGGVLKVKRKKPFKIKEYEREAIEVRITYKVLRRIKASAGSDVTNQTTISGDQLMLDFNSGAEGHFDVELGDLDMSVSEGATLKVKGTTDSQNSRVATGAVLSAYQLGCKRAYVKASTGGDAKVNATEVLEAKANTGGSINYQGNPSKVKIKDSLGGNVNEH